MGKRTPTIEWQIAEDDAEWAQICASAAPVDRNRRLALRWLGEGIILLLLLGSAGIGWRSSTQANLQQRGTLVGQPADHATTDSSANRPRVAWVDPYAPVVTRLQESLNLSGRLDLTLQPNNRQGDRVARVTLVDPVGVPVYRQTLFYQHTGRDWVRVAPNAALWGAPQQLTTPSFVFHFRGNDAAAVTAVAPQVDALYTRLQCDYGLPMTGIAEKVTIAVSVTQPVVTYAPAPNRAPARIDVPSPALYLAPVELTDTELLSQSIALPLLDQVLAQTRERYAIAESWQPLLHGLYLWQLWELDLPLAVWREEVVTWLYTDLPTSRSSQTVVLPARYQALCTAHKLWLSSPSAIKIPLACGKMAWEDFLLSPWSWSTPPSRLDQLTVPLRPGVYLEEPDSLHRTPHPGQTVALATLIEYAVATYGRERLPALVAGLGQYESWETLLPAVYGVSAAEFETGWQAYLAVHYGVAESRSE